MTKRIAAAITVAVIAAGLGTAYAATGASTATGIDGFTPVAQTRVLDSGRLAGDALLGSGKSQSINPNAVTAGLVPAGATAVEIQITAASETSINGDLDVYPAGSPVPATSNLNYVKGVPITSDTVATLGTGGKFEVYNHGGGAGSVRLIVDVLGYFAPVATYTPPTATTWNLPAADQGETINTGGSAATRSTDVGTLTLDPGTYLLSVNAKVTPTVQANADTQVSPSFFVYDQAISSSFTGDLVNFGGNPIESGANANIDAYFGATQIVTITAPNTTLHFISFGYDNDRGEGTYTLDTMSVSAVPQN